MKQRWEKGTGRYMASKDKPQTLQTKVRKKFLELLWVRQTEEKIEEGLKRARKKRKGVRERRREKGG